jgi:hypothetical protein
MSPVRGSHPCEPKTRWGWSNSWSRTSAEHRHRNDRGGHQGWSELALRESQLLTGARDIEYKLDEDGVITVDWIEGPCAAEVAAGLAAYSAAGLLEVYAVAPATSSSDIRADLLVAGLPVQLMAHEQIGMEQASRRGRPPRHSQPGWSWPSPLRQDGAAKDTVPWTVDRREGEVATVVRLPIGRPTRGGPKARSLSPLAGPTA